MKLRSRSGSESHGQGRRVTAGIWLAARSLLWTLLLPGLFAGLLPWRYFGLSQVVIDSGSPGQMTALAVIGVGAALLGACIWEFARHGRGTLAPVDPPRELVVQGVYRYVRNPMYLSVTVIVLGEALLIGSRALLAYWAAWFAAANLFVIGYEEPALRRRFGVDYERYQASVSRWLPRRTRTPPITMPASPADTSRAGPLTTPLDAGQRLYALDILRGLALFGMILVHFHQKMRIEVTGLEDLIGWAIWVLVEQKAWGVFAFLFGVGFAVLLRRLESRGAAVVPVYLRRLAALACFGVIADVAFGFRILFAYACWGLALLVVRRWSTRTLLFAAALAVCARPVAAELTALHAWWTATTPAPATGTALRQAVDAAAHQDSYAALLAARWAFFVGTIPRTWREVLPDANLTLFILGLLAVRHRILDEPKRHATLIAGWMAFGAIAWAVSWLVLGRLPATGIPGADWPIAYGFGLVQDQWLCFSYIGAVVLLLAYRPEWTAHLAGVGLAGRMALTNYMVQAAVLDVLASGYGLGLKLRPLAYAPAAVALFGVEAAASAVWLARFRFGPLEWVWRTVTYARRQPLRRSTASRGAVPRGGA